VGTEANTGDQGGGERRGGKVEIVFFLSKKRARHPAERVSGEGSEKGSAAKHKGSPRFYVAERGGDNTQKKQRGGGILRRK